MDHCIRIKGVNDLARQLQKAVSNILKNSKNYFLMKTSKVLFLSSLFVLLSGLSTFAHGPVTSPSKSETLSTQISKLIAGIDLSNMPYDTQRMHVEFIVNNDNEIVVLDVSDPKFEAQIISRLNYQKINAPGVEKNKLFLIPVSMERR